MQKTTSQPTQSVVDVRDEGYNITVVAYGTWITTSSSDIGRRVASGRSEGEGVNIDTLGDILM